MRCMKRLIGKLLDKWYGNAYCLVESVLYGETVETGPQITPGGVEGLDRLCLFLVEVQNAMAGIQKGVLEHPCMLREAIQRLPVSA